MKKYLGALILTACASFLNAYDGCSSCPSCNPCPTCPTACPSGRCVQGCNPRTGMRTDGAYQQGPQGAYQPGQGQYPEGQYQPYPQGPYQQGQGYSFGSSQYESRQDDQQQYGQQYVQPYGYGPGAAGQPSGQQGAPAQQNDQQMTGRIQDSLRSAFSSKYNNVRVSVNNGVVTLQGTVPSQDDRKDLEEKVRDFDGVRSVNNQVTVQPEQKQTYGGASQGYTQGTQGANPGGQGYMQGYRN